MHKNQSKQTNAYISIKQNRRENGTFVINIVAELCASCLDMNLQNKSTGYTSDWNVMYQDIAKSNYIITAGGD